MPKYYTLPFASSGTRTSVPDGTQVDGSVSYTDGYGADYALPLDTDPAALAPERDKWNQLWYDITANVQQYQQHGIPEFITSADNGGSAYSYAQGAMCRNGGVNYVSTLAGNTNTPPGTGWVVFDGVNITGNAATATKLATARAIGGVNFDGSAAITPQQIQPASDTSDTTCYPVFFNDATATAQQPKYNSSFSYNASTNTLTATGFVGALTGNASTATALATARAIGGVNFDGTADITPINITPASEPGDTTCFIAFFNSASATAQQPKYNSSLTYNASTGAFAAITLGGTLTTAAQPNITSVGTLTGGATGAGFTVALTASTITGTLTVTNGGTGVTSATPYAVLCGGTTSTGAYQPVASVGTSGQVLTSNGPGALPTFQNATAGGGITIQTPVATTSGTSVALSTTVPSTAKQVIINLSGVRTSGSSDLLIQVGPSSGVVITGYLAGSSTMTSAVGTHTSTAGFNIYKGISATDTMNATITLNLENSSTNNWVAAGDGYNDVAGRMMVAAGKVALSGALAKVTLTTVNGTDAFAAGEAGVSYI